MKKQQLYSSTFQFARLFIGIKQNRFSLLTTLGYLGNKRTVVHCPLPRTHPQNKNLKTHHWRQKIRAKEKWTSLLTTKISLYNVQPCTEWIEQLSFWKKGFFSVFFGSVNFYSEIIVLVLRADKNYMKVSVEFLYLNYHRIGHQKSLCWDRCIDQISRQLVQDNSVHCFY